MIVSKFAFPQVSKGVIGKPEAPFVRYPLYGVSRMGLHASSAQHSKPMTDPYGLHLLQGE